eukprot:1869163-Amphidinium_carterae.1
MFMHRWFERPLFRRQQAEDGVGPFFCLGIGTGEFADKTEFNRKWILENFSEDAQEDASTYLDTLNNWTETSVQGIVHETRDTACLRTALVFVSTHMPWIVSTCVEWMGECPCKNNNAYLMDNAVDDAYGRFLGERRPRGR